MAYFVDDTKKSELERAIFINAQQLPASRMLPYLRTKLDELWTAFTAPKMRVDTPPPKMWDRGLQQAIESITGDLKVVGSMPRTQRVEEEREVLGPITLNLSIAQRDGGHKMAMVMGGIAVQPKGRTQFEDMVVGCLYATVCQAMQDRSMVWLSNRLTLNKDSFEPKTNAAITDLQARIPMAIVYDNFAIARARMGGDLRRMVAETNAFLRTHDMGRPFDMVRDRLRLSGHGDDAVFDAGVELSEKVDRMAESIDFYRQDSGGLAVVSDNYNNSGTK